jgi:hypothetical protein
MRKYLALAAVLGVTACGGGGGGTAVPNGNGGTQSVATPTPSPSPGSGTQAKYATPTFHITIPKSAGTKKLGKTPLFVSTAIQSISIELTEVNGSATGLPTTGNPAVSSISSATCSSGCTVNGPPSPITGSGSGDTFVLTTYDGTGGTGNALDTATGTYAIAQGTNNAETITLDGIPATIAVMAVPNTWTENIPASTPIGGATSTGIEVVAYDADSEIITGTYANPITFQDPDSQVYGTWVSAGSCGATGTGSASSITLTTDTGTAGNLCYGGIGEEPVTFNVTATGVTEQNPQFQTILNAPTYISGSATGVASDATQEIDLYDTSGTGSVGSVAYQELGWTNSPYSQQLVVITTSPCSLGGPLSTFAGISSAAYTPPAGTAFTATAIGSPAAGACTVQIGDNLQSNATVAGATFVVTYTTSGFNVTGRGRKH